MSRAISHRIVTIVVQMASLRQLALFDPLTRIPRPARQAVAKADSWVIKQKKVQIFK